MCRLPPIAVFTTEASTAGEYELRVASGLWLLIGTHVFEITEACELRGLPAVLPLDPRVNAAFVDAVASSVEAAEWAELSDEGDRNEAWPAFWLARSGRLSVGFVGSELVGWLGAPGCRWSCCGLR